MLTAVAARPRKEARTAKPRPQRRSLHTAWKVSEKAPDPTPETRQPLGQQIGELAEATSPHFASTTDRSTTYVRKNHFLLSPVAARFLGCYHFLRLGYPPRRGKASLHKPTWGQVLMVSAKALGPVARALMKSI